MTTPRKTRPYVAVVGAGINGLSAAVQLQNALPDADVTLIADRFERETVSDGAAGLFRPTADYIPGVPRHLIKQWSEDSWAYFSALAHSELADQAGVGIVSGYQFFSEGQQEKDPLHREIVFSSRNLVQKDFEIFPGTEQCKSGFFSTALIIESRWFLPFLMNKFKANGGKVERRTVHSIEELSGKYDVVINCSGSGARDLVKDEQVSPIRGQMMRIKAPWVKHYLYVDHNCWIIPGKETVTIGGTRQIGNLDENISAKDRDEMFERACRFMPSLKNAEIAWEWVGMRPSRVPVRVDQEVLKFGLKKLLVVHNYGHGGNGIALSWGCSKHAVSLVCQGLSENMSSL